MRRHTPGPWRVSSSSCVYGSVVADVSARREPRSERDVELDLEEVNGYGGYLIAESIALQNRPLIVAAPELYNACADAFMLISCALDIEDKELARLILERTSQNLEKLMTGIYEAEKGVDGNG